MSSKPISDLHRRMISDMTVRSFSAKTQLGDIDSERMPIRVEMGKGPQGVGADRVVTASLRRCGA